MLLQEFRFVSTKTIVIIDTILWKIVKIFEFTESGDCNSILFHLNKLYIGVETGLRTFKIEFDKSGQVYPNTGIIEETFLKKKIGKLGCAFKHQIICTSGMALKFFDVNFQHSHTINIPNPTNEHFIFDVFVSNCNEIFVLHGKNLFHGKRTYGQGLFIVPSAVSTITTTHKHVISSVSSRQRTPGAKSDNCYYAKMSKKLKKYGKLTRFEPSTCLQNPEPVETPQSDLSFMSMTIGTKSDFNHIILSSCGFNEIEQIILSSEIE